MRSSLVSLKGHEAMFLPCSSHHAARPWNPAAECKINGQSKPARLQFRSTGGFRRDRRRDGRRGLAAGPLIPRSHGLLKRNPRRGTFGSAGVGSFGSKAPRPISARRDEQLRLNTSGIIHLRPRECASIQGTQPRFSWPLSKQLTSRIMHHLLCLSGKQMEAVVIGVAQRERTRLDQRASWEIPSFFFLQALHAKTPSDPNPYSPPIVFIVLYIIATRN